MTIMKKKCSELSRQVKRNAQITRYLLLATLTVSSTLFAGHGVAADYHMEMIVFLRSPALVQTIEQPVPANFSPVPDNFYRLASEQASEQEQAFEAQALQTRPLSRLAASYNRLSSNDDFKILYSAAWTQPLRTGSHTLPLRIRSLEQAPGIFQFEGTLSLVRDRAVQANVDLAYAELELVPTNHAGYSMPVSNSQEETTGDIENTAAQAAKETSHKLTGSDNTGHWQVTSSYQLSRQSRLQTGEINYLDNPWMGVLLYAKPLD